jgi:hypothetical protein
MIAANRCAARFLAAGEPAAPLWSTTASGAIAARIANASSGATPGVRGTGPRHAGGLPGPPAPPRAREHPCPCAACSTACSPGRACPCASGPHMGMSLPAYTNCTSPLRKYLDFLVHLQIKALLRGEEADLCDQQELDALHKRLQRCAAPARRRSAGWRSNTCSAWMPRSRAPGRSRLARRPGFHGAPRRQRPRGFVDLRTKRKSSASIATRPPSTASSRAFRVDMPVLVTLAGVDDDTPHLALFASTRPGRCGDPVDAAAAEPEPQESGSAPEGHADA